MKANDSILREKLISYLTKADSKKVNALYTLLEDEIDEEALSLTEEQKKILDQDHEDYLKGQGTSYTWEEAKELIRSKKAS